VAAGRFADHLVCVCYMQLPSYRGL